VLCYTRFARRLASGVRWIPWECGSAHIATEQIPMMKTYASRNSNWNFLLISKVIQVMIAVQETFKW
jgi:hypothetical protein